MNPASVALYWCAVGLYVCAALRMAGYVLRPGRGRPGPGRWLAAVGFVAHTAALTLVAAESGNIPINNVFESFVFLLWCIALVGIVIDAVYRVPTLGAFLLPVLVVLAVAAAYFVDDKGELPAGVTLFWQLAHIAPIFLGYAAFAGAFVLSAMYLVQQRQLKDNVGGSLWQRLPSLEALDKLSSHAILWGFPLLTVGIMFGLVWMRSQRLLLAHPLSDGKVICGTATWVVYAALLVLRLRGRAPGRRLAALTVASFLFVLVTFAGAFFMGGRHAFRSPTANSNSQAAR